MTVTIAGWMLPVVATAAIWAWTILHPTEPRRGDYDFGGALVGMFRLSAAIIATLSVWLVYFVVLALWK